MQHFTKCLFLSGEEGNSFHCDLVHGKILNKLAIQLSEGVDAHRGEPIIPSSCSFLQSHGECSTNDVASDAELHRGTVVSNMCHHITLLVRFASLNLDSL